MNIYLDIDGVILTKDSKPANHLKEFLEHITGNNNVYWLTTHCKGDSAATLTYLSRFFDKDVLELLKKVKPTSWETLKTKAIDFNEEFVWLDDFLLEAEKGELTKNDKLDSWIEVNLKENSDQLREVMETLGQG